MINVAEWIIDGRTTVIENCRLWTVGCELIWKFQKARPHNAPEGKRKLRHKAICSNRCLISSYQVSNMSDEYCELWIDSNSRGTLPQCPLGEIEKSGFERLCSQISCIILPITKIQLNRVKIVGCESIWKFWEVRPTVLPGGKTKSSAPSDCANWYLLSFYQVSNKSDKYCWLWIDLNSKSAPLDGNRKMQLQAIVWIDVWYHPIKFKLNRAGTFVVYVIHR